MYLVGAALANIPFWIATGLSAQAGVSDVVFTALLSISLLLGGFGGGQFLASRVPNGGLGVPLRVAAVATLINVIFGIGTFEFQRESYVLIMAFVLTGFFVGTPLGYTIGSRRQSPFT